MLPEDAKIHFDTLCASRFADAWTEFEIARKEFERSEFSRGQSPGTPGFAARLASLYVADFNKRSNIILDALKQVHTDFERPLDEGIDVQLNAWGTRAVSEQLNSLEGAYVRYLQRFGVGAMHPSGLADRLEIQLVGVRNTINKYLWDLRNLPVNKPRPAVLPQTTLNVGGNLNIGSVQTAEHSVANVRQQMTQPANTEISSRGQSGGITAHTVNVGGGVQSAKIDEGTRGSRKPLWLKASSWAIGLVGLVASVLGILDYLNVKLWR